MYMITEAELDQVEGGGVGFQVAIAALTGGVTTAISLFASGSSMDKTPAWIWAFAGIGVGVAALSGFFVWWTRSQTKSARDNLVEVDPKP